MAEQDIQRYIQALQRLDEMGDRAYKTLTELQAQLVKSVQNQGLSSEIQRITLQLKEMAEAYTKIRSQLTTARAGGAPPVTLDQPGQRPNDEYTKSLQEAARKIRESANKEPSAAEKRAQAERERLEALRASVKAEKRYARAIALAEEQGFKLSNLTQVRTRGTGGVEQLRFQRTGDIGEQRQLDLFVNQQGKATPGISNQFRTFGQGVVRDIGELTKWSIALAAIYGPMRKLQELTETMIENQTKLAEASIAVSSSFTDQGDIFEAAASAARSAGEEITGVIDAFTLAYRATGGAGTEVERFATANRLLSDALTLSKLSSLDQATAIDTLAAALRQTTGDLDKGVDLLDKWVRVTKIANVDLATLATGFAVLGDAAEAAGINADELNGILAAIAETGVASAKEGANVARAIVAGFQSDSAKKAFESLGIAVEDSTGKMRDHLDIAKDVYNLRKSGIISDTQFSALTLDVGQGTRRQAAVATYLENLDRVFQVAKESSQAGGEAQEALNKQLQTVQTSLTRLGNSFEELAQTMGTEGGFLTIVTESVDAMTGLVNIFDDLISLLGKATPAMALFVAATVALKSQGAQGGVQAYLGGLVDPRGGRGITGQLVSGSQFTRPSLRGIVSKDILGTGISSGISQGVLAAAIPAILNATNKEDRFGGTKAVANLAGGVVGGIVGSLTGPQGTLIGAVIGTSIAEAFINSTIDRKTDIFGYATPTALGEPGKLATDTGDLDEALRQAEIRLYESIGGGSEATGRAVTAGSYETGKKLVDRINKAIEEQDEEELNRILKGRYAPTEKQLQNLGLSTDLIRRGFEENRQLDYSPENIAYRAASEEARRAYDEALAARSAVGDTENIETPFSRLLEQNKSQFSDLLNSIKTSSKEELTQQRISGDIGGADYTRRLQALGGFDTKALQYYTALGEELIDINEYADNAADAFNIFNEVIVSGASDSVPEITSIVAEIQQLVNLLEDPVLNKDALAAFGGAEEARQKLSELRQAGASLIGDVYKQSLVSGIEVPELRGDINKPISVKEFNETKQRARELQDEFYQGFLKIPDDMYDALKESWDEWAQVIGEAGDVFYSKVSEIDPKFFQQALSEVTGEGGGGQFNIQTVDLPSSEKPRLQAMISYYDNFLKQKFPEYKLNDEEFGVIFKDNVTDILHGDNLSIRLALEKLIDVNQKQLDGIYNLPEGATAWVPAQLAEALAGGGGIGPTDEELAGSMAFGRNEDQLPANVLNKLIRNQELISDPRRGRGYEEIDREAMEDPRRGRGYNRSTVLEDIYYRSKDDIVTGTESQPGAIAPSLDMSGLLESFRAILGSVQSLFTRPEGAYPGYGGETQVPEVSSKLDLTFESNTTLTVDGRVLASVVKSYLAQELLQAQQTQSTVTRKYVI